MIGDNMNIDEVIKEKHQNDQYQLDAIFSDQNRIMLVAPAGCGKTKTLISKISYLLCTNNMIRKSKKILALTFSVNAAFKIKKDVFDFCPNITELSNDYIKSKICISNYHGLARMILSKYGYLLDNRLKRINEILPLEEKMVTELTNCNLNSREKELIICFEEKVKSCDREYISDNLETYYNLMIKLLDIDVITYNSYLVYLIVLFNKNEKLLEFYQNIYPIIMIDEFQDTNYLSWIIVNKLITEKTALFFMGDKLQRIYGFIGAIPDLIDEAIATYNMKEIVLSKNYRFKNNPEMLLLDNNLRKNSNDEFESISKNAEVKLKITNTLAEEISYAKRVIKFANEKNSKLAILVQSRSGNLSKILENFDANGIKYFYALFTENDQEYINFHINCAAVFSSMFKGERIGKTFLYNVYNKIVDLYQSKKSMAVNSLLTLLRLFFDRINIDYGFLTEDEKGVLIADTFASRTLKQNMDLVDTNVVVSTIHGAKGLEWDYVYFPSFNDYVIPNYQSLCKFCSCTHIGDYCHPYISNDNKKEYLEELSVFYVGVTRAKKEILFSASKERVNKNGNIHKSYISCLLSLKGISIIEQFK